MPFEGIRQGIEGLMVAKGFVQAHSGELSPVLTLGARDKADANTWGRFSCQVSVYQHAVGKMSLDVFDATSKRALWRDSAT